MNQYQVSLCYTDTCALFLEVYSVTIRKGLNRSCGDYRIFH